MENPMRNFIVERISTLLDIPASDPICINIEKNILNYAIAVNTCGPTVWENINFTKMDSFNGNEKPECRWREHDPIR